MFALCWFVVSFLALPFKSKSRLEAENAALRHQLIVLRRKVPRRVRLTNKDRWFLIQLYRWFPSILQVVTIIQPETLVQWHRAGFRLYWRWKSRSQGGRPRIEAELRALIRQMSLENPLWGAPRIHGELLKLGYEVAGQARHRILPPNHGRTISSGGVFTQPGSFATEQLSLRAYPCPLMLQAATNSDAACLFAKCH